MPEYNYECKQCGLLRITQSIKSDVLKECPICCGADIQRVLSDNVGFEIKGYSEKNKYSKEK